MEKQKKLYEIENVQMNVLETTDLSFERQYQNYIEERMTLILKDWKRFEKFTWYLENDRMIKAIEYLKEQEQKILFARIFGEFTFSELGDKFDMKPKQAEMLFYYVIRKLRKELDADKEDDI